MKLDENQKRVLLTNLSKKLKDPECPLCKQKNTFEMYEVTGQMTSTTGSHIDYALACCKNCGFLIQLRLDKLGVDF